MKRILTRMCFKYNKHDILNNMFNDVKNFFVKTIYKFILTLTLIIFLIVSIN